MTGRVVAEAVFETGLSWADFTRGLAEGQRARVGVVVELRQAEAEGVGDVAARVEALFAAVPP